MFSIKYFIHYHSTHSGKQDSEDRHEWNGHVPVLAVSPVIAVQVLSGHALEFRPRRVRKSPERPVDDLVGAVDGAVANHGFVVGKVNLNILKQNIDSLKNNETCYGYYILTKRVLISVSQFRAKSKSLNSLVRFLGGGRGMVTESHLKKLWFSKTAKGTIISKSRLSHCKIKSFFLINLTKSNFSPTGLHFSKTPFLLFSVCIILASFIFDFLPLT
jgi:hypothetical protein